MTARLVVLDASGPMPVARQAPHADLAAMLAPGDLVVVNDSATLPASLSATVEGAVIELRLARRLGARDWTVLAFGAGDFRTPTERRPPPPAVRPGHVVRFADDFTATVVHVDDSAHGRFFDVRFDALGGALVEKLYRYGKPIQYAHTTAPYELWDVQNFFAGPPWSVEPPSAGRIVGPSTLDTLRRRGIALATVTHAAGLSSTGDPALDERLPLPERFAVPPETVAAVTAARRTGGRVIAVGTSTFRALESSAAAHRRVGARHGETHLVVTRDHRRQVVDGIVTGLHEEGSSHFRLLESFVDRMVLRATLADAFAAGHRAHEHGDALLILRPLAATTAAAITKSERTTPRPPATSPATPHESRSSTSRTC